MESFMHEYQHFSDKEQFLKDKEELYGVISVVCLKTSFVRLPYWLITARPSMRKVAKSAQWVSSSQPSAYNSMQEVLCLTTYPQQLFNLNNVVM
ncbi:hypothetical protein OG21DRAFT_1203039 [Imleria badia]|nr:hypothetical protein OG21DRAFT_1203039 [Imleria badia]